MSDVDNSLNAMTALRSEVKYILSKQQVQTFKAVLKQNIASHSFTKGKHLTQVSTIYFDTKCLSLFKASLENPMQNTKIRAREYYYYNNELMEHALQHEDLYEHSEDIFLEVKVKNQNQTSKNRLLVPRSLLQIAKSHKISSNEYLDTLVNINPKFSKEPFASIVQDFANNTIVPVAAVHYARNAYENSDSSLRISLDQKMSFHSMSQSEFDVNSSWRKEYLPESLYDEANTILEVKSLTQPPSWLQETLSNLKPQKYSKFIECMKVIYHDSK